MLVLQRKKDESIVIDGNITITIVDIGNDRVKISIDAPREISILRSELIEAANANKEAASLDNTPNVFALNSLLKK
ncbi:MAG: carbon storage regulator [Peptostreptococcaceae bacterium]|nr:carbon storage regulator [Peptostreptococcaceae bacterium]